MHAAENELETAVAKGKAEGDKARRKVEQDLQTANSKVRLWPPARFTLSIFAFSFFGGCC